MAVGVPPFYKNGGGYEQPPPASGQAGQKSARDETPQGVVEVAQPVQQPPGQGRKSKGRDGKAHHQQGDPIEHISLDGQHQHPGPTQHKGQNGQDSGGEGQQEWQDNRRSSCQN